MRSNCVKSTVGIISSILVLTACGGSSDDQPAAVAAPAATELSDPALEAAAATFADTASAPTGGDPALPNLVPSINDSGFAATFSKAGVIDRTGPFFQSLGATGRGCSSCHIQAEGWTIIPAGVQARFEKTEGLDPIFRTVDGSNSPLADVSTVDTRRRAYSMLLSKGLIRVGMPIPDNAEFELVEVDDPYGFASAKQLSLFRRPLPSANVEFLSTVMWDGRETFKDPAFVGLRAEHDELLCDIALRPRQSIEQRHARTCRSQGSADARAAQRDRRFRDGAFCRADLRS